MTNSKYRVAYPGNIHLPCCYVVHEFINLDDANQFISTLDKSQVEYTVDEMRKDGGWYTVYQHDIMEYELIAERKG